MLNIVIISSSVRDGRKSHRLALFFSNFIEKMELASTEILDLKELQFPVFQERLKFQENKMPEAMHFSEKIRSSDGVIIVTPEYNGAYPASLKNAIDLLTDEWHRKPVAISTVSDGSFGGSQVITSLQFVLWKMRALTVPAMFPVPRVDEAFDENGNPSDKEVTEKRAKIFLGELFRIIKFKK